MRKGVYVPEADAYIAGKTPQDLVILEDLGSIHRLKYELGAEFEFVDGRWLARFKDLQFVLRSKFDSFLLCEVFRDRAYAIPMDEPPALALDIGMNVGAAALWMAREFGCQVHGFELCAPTFEIAEENMALNPREASLVHRHAFGLSDEDATLEIPYLAASSGDAGIFGLNTAPGAAMLQVEVRRASEVLRPILDAAPPGPVFAKLDCEGAEFPILRDLAASGLLSRIDVLAMEWHRGAGDPRELAEALERSGHAVSLQTIDESLGYLRATRTPVTV